MSFVLDASVVLAWLLPDEQSQTATRLIERVTYERARAPSLLMLEVGNALLQAERRSRISPATRIELLDAFTFLSVGLEPIGAESMLLAVQVAARHSISLYDACYLELAARRHCALATFDHRLARAATSEGVDVLGAGGGGIN